MYGCMLTCCGGTVSSLEQLDGCRGLLLLLRLLWWFTFGALYASYGQGLSSILLEDDLFEIEHSDHLDHGRTTALGPILLLPSCKGPCRVRECRDSLGNLAWLMVMCGGPFGWLVGWKGNSRAWGRYIVGGGF